MKKPTVLTFTLFYLPGFRAGGPIRTISSLVERLGDEVCFRIVTQDRDSADVVPYSGIAKECWNSVGKAEVLYVDRSNVGLRSILRIVREVSPDLIYLNSFFDYLFTQKVLLLKKIGALGDIPVVLAPRGEFSKGALAIRRLKKRAYIRCASIAGLYRGVIWHASSAMERADILREFPSADEGRIRVAMNLASKSAPLAIEHGRPWEGRLRVCFLSRISPKKNLLYALQCMAKVTAEIEFSIFGPKEVPEYWDACEKVMARIPKNIMVEYRGEVEHQRVRQVLSEHDVFFFPTLGENFGHVIHEALSAGLPVITSDQTPWLDLEVKGVGWALPLSNEDAFVQVLERIAGMDEEERRAMARRAQAYAAEREGDASVLEANRALFLDVCRG